MAETIHPVSLAEETQRRYLNYAVSVISARALPDVRDGLKPVQRRILYTMYHELHAQYPNLHVNGVSGIAVGMATNIPPHNLGEVLRASVYLIDNPDASVAQLLDRLKGPDFPLGGKVVTDRSTLRKIYEEGTG